MSATGKPLEKELAQSRHQLATLTGRLPDEASALPAFDLDGLQLPEEPPLSLPSSLVRRGKALNCVQLPFFQD
jgi:outer membrane protein TolC